MWTTNELGLAIWEANGSAWYVDARGGEHGIGVISTEKSGADAFAETARAVAFPPVDEDRLPIAGEQYVRGDEWHVNYPQGDCSYALRMAFAAIETKGDALVLEVTVSVQTDLLDLHPKLDIEVMCNDIDSFVPSDAFGDDEVRGTGSAPISLAKNRDFSSSVLLGPHDSPFTTNHSTDSMLRLRLFGDFLEKGVIRKARPWIVIQRSETPSSEEQLESIWKQLCESPLPLTP